MNGKVTMSQGEGDGSKPYNTTGTQFNKKNDGSDQPMERLQNRENIKRGMTSSQQRRFASYLKGNSKNDIWMNTHKSSAYKKQELGGHLKYVPERQQNFKKLQLSFKSNQFADDSIHRQLGSGHKMNCKLSERDLQSPKQQVETLRSRQDLCQKYMTNIITVSPMVSKNMRGSLMQKRSSINSRNNHLMNIQNSKGKVPFSSHQHRPLDHKAIQPVLTRSSHLAPGTVGMATCSCEYLKNDKFTQLQQSLGSLNATSSLMFVEGGDQDESGKVSLAQLKTIQNPAAPTEIYDSKTSQDDDEYQIKQSFSTQNVQSLTASGPRIKKKKMEAAETAKKNYIEASNANILKQTSNKQASGKGSGLGLIILKNKNDNQNKFDQYNDSKFKMPFAGNNLSGGSLNTSGPSTSNVTDKNQNQEISVRQNNFSGARQSGGAAHHSHSTIQRSKNFEKVSISDLKQNLSKIRTQKRNINDGTQIQKIMNETMKNYKTNLKLKQQKNQEDDTSRIEFGAMQGKLKEQKTKLSNLNQYQLKQNTDLQKKQRNHGENSRYPSNMKENSTDQTHLPKINFKFKAYQDIQNSNSQKNIDRANGKLTHDPSQNQLEIIPQKPQNSKIITDQQLTQPRTSQNQNKSNLNDRISQVAVMQDIDKRNQTLRLEIIKRQKQIDQRNQQKNRQTAGPSLLYGIAPPPNLKNGNINESSNDILSQSLMNKSNYQTIGHINNQIDAENFVSTDFDQQNVDLEVSDFPNEYSRPKSPNKAFDTLMTEKQQQMPQVVSKSRQNVKELKEMLSFTQEILDQKEKNLNLSAINGSKTHNSRSQTQLVTQQQNASVDRGKSLSKAYLGHPQTKNMTSHQKLQPITKTHDPSSISQTVPHFSHSTIPSKRMSSYHSKHSGLIATGGLPAAPGASKASRLHEAGGIRSGSYHGNGSINGFKYSEKQRLSENRGVSSVSGLNVTFRREMEQQESQQRALRIANMMLGESGTQSGLGGTMGLGNPIIEQSMFTMSKTQKRPDAKTDSKVAMINKVYTGSNSNIYSTIQQHPNHNRLQISNESLISAQQQQQIEMNSDESMNLDLPMNNINDSKQNSQVLEQDQMVDVYKQIQTQANTIINQKAQGQSILKKNVQQQSSFDKKKSSQYTTMVNDAVLTDNLDEQTSLQFEHSISLKPLQKVPQKVKIQSDTISAQKNEDNLSSKRRSNTLEPIKQISNDQMPQICSNANNNQEKLKEVLEKIQQNNLMSNNQEQAKQEFQLTMVHKAMVKRAPGNQGATHAADHKKKKKFEDEILEKVENGKLDRYDIIKNAYDREAKLKILNINLMSKEELMRQQIANEKKKIPQVKCTRLVKPQQDLQIKLREAHGFKDDYQVSTNRIDESMMGTHQQQQRLLDSIKGSKHRISKDHNDDVNNQQKRYNVKQIYGHNHGRAAIEEEQIRENGKLVTKLKLDPAVGKKIIKCRQCQKMKFDTNLNKTRKIDATPAKYRGLGRVHALSETKSSHLQKPEDNLSHGYETGSSVNKMMLSPIKDQSPVKRSDLVRESYGSSGKSPNLLRFLQTDKSKTRVLLAKAYNLKVEKELEFIYNQDPSTKWNKFKNDFENQKVQTARDHSSEMVGTSNNVMHNSLSPRTSRRKINALMPSFIKKNYQFKENKYDSPERREQRFIKKIQQNTPQQNFYLFQDNHKIRSLFSKLGKTCNCDSKMINEVSINQSVYSFNRRYRMGNSVMESQAEYLDDVKSLAELTIKGSHVHGPRGRASYVPCRRTCSTIHNPIFHRGRHDSFFQKEQKKVRVQSADNNNKKKDYSHLDWGNTQIQQMVDVARINKSIALQKLNNEDGMDVQSMVDDQTNTIQFAKEAQAITKNTINAKQNNKKRSKLLKTVDQKTNNTNQTAKTKKHDKNIQLTPAGNRSKSKRRHNQNRDGKNNKQHKSGKHKSSDRNQSAEKVQQRQGRTASRSRGQGLKKDQKSSSGQSTSNSGDSSSVIVSRNGGTTKQQKFAKDKSKEKNNNKNKKIQSREKSIPKTSNLTKNQTNQNGFSYADAHFSRKKGSTEAPSRIKRKKDQTDQKRGERSRSRKGKAAAGAGATGYSSTSSEEERVAKQGQKGSKFQKGGKDGTKSKKKGRGEGKGKEKRFAAGNQSKDSEGSHDEDSSESQAESKSHDGNSDDIESSDDGFGESHQFDSDGTEIGPDGQKVERSPSQKEQLKKDRKSRSTAKKEQKKRDKELKQRGYAVKNEDPYGDLINIKIQTKKTIKSSSGSESESDIEEYDVDQGPIGQQLIQAAQMSSSHQPKQESLAIQRLRALGYNPVMAEEPSNHNEFDNQSPLQSFRSDPNGPVLRNQSLPRNVQGPGSSLKSKLGLSNPLQLQRLGSENVYANLTAENLQQFGYDAKDSSRVDKKEIYGSLGQGGLGGVDGLGTRGDRDLKKFMSKKQRKKYEKQKQLELNDLKFLFRNIDYEMQQMCKDPTFSNQECEHLYSMVKEISLVNQNLFVADKLHEMVKTALRTLRILMESLILTQEHKIIAQAYKQKLNFEAQKISKIEKQKEIQVEQLKKILLRCKRCYEAKYQLVRILVKAKKREYLLNLMDETMEQSMTEGTAKQYYFTLLKLSCKIYNMVQLLRTDHPMLNRPFIYQGVNLQTHMIKQILNVRENLNKKFPSLQQNKALDRVLDKTGKIILVSELSLLNQELSSKKGALQALVDIFREAKDKIKNKQKNMEMRQVLIGQIRDQKDSSLTATF